MTRKIYRIIRQCVNFMEPGVWTMEFETYTNNDINFYKGRYMISWSEIPSSDLGCLILHNVHYYVRIVSIFSLRNN